MDLVNTEISNKILILDTASIVFYITFVVVVGFDEMCNLKIGHKQLGG